MFRIRTPRRDYIPPFGQSSHLFEHNVGRSCIGRFAIMDKASPALKPPCRHRRYEPKEPGVTSKPATCALTFSSRGPDDDQ
jgi:hypothetical protein